MKIEVKLCLGGQRGLLSGEKSATERAEGLGEHVQHTIYTWMKTLKRAKNYFIEVRLPYKRPYVCVHEFQNGISHLNIS